MNQPAVQFLNRCFAPDETIALLLRRESAPSITQRVVRMERALEPRYQAWLSYENGTGANIYVAANPLRAGSRKRTKENIASVRHLYIDVDTDGDARLAALRASDSVPSPTSILSTSPGKYQVLWRVEGLDFETQERTLKLLARIPAGVRNKILTSIADGMLHQVVRRVLIIQIGPRTQLSVRPSRFRGGLQLLIGSNVARAPGPTPSQIFPVRFHRRHREHWPGGGFDHQYGHYRQQRSHTRSIENSCYAAPKRFLKCLN